MVAGVTDTTLTRTRSPLLYRVGTVLLLVFASSISYGQSDNPGNSSRAWADSVYFSFENNRLDDPSRALGIFDSVLKVLAQYGDTCRMARVSSWRSHCFDKVGELDSAVVVAQKALKWFRPSCDSVVLMSIRVNMGNALLSLGEYAKVKKISEEGIAQWNETWAYSISRNGLYTNRAIAIANLGDLQGALEAFRDVLRNAQAEQIAQNEVDALSNLGAVFGVLSNNGTDALMLDSSAHYQELALQISKRLEDRAGVMLLYSNLSSLAYDRGRFRNALVYADSARSLAAVLKSRDMLSTAAALQAKCYRELRIWDSAYYYLEVHRAHKDTLLDEEKVKAITEMQEKYESEKKAKEILGLKAVNLESELEKVQVKRTRNIYLFSAIGVVGLAIALWARLRFVHRSRAAIQKEKDISEGLLHNILPEEVATELKAKGYADVKEFEQATILFTDFKGFTQLTEKLTAAQLVAEIDHCFRAFDGIMEKYRIEKIKTIGDAYMAAGGLPDTAHGHPLDVVRAALEMQAFMASYKAERAGQDRLFFEMRVGIHTGPVIAGIVGVKKFAYDIWGDTVNTASRMESSGEVGQVNISESTYELVKEVPELCFAPRGKVQAKGKGEMEMYFVAAA